LPATAQPLRPEAIVSHLERLARAARALCGSREEAEDLVQDTCVQLLSRRSVVFGGDELPYLLVALRNTHVSRRRAAARRVRAVALDSLEPVDHRVALAEQVVARELVRSICALPEEARAAVLAVDVAGLSRAEAASVLGVGRQRVAVALARGRAALRAKDQGSSWTPPTVAAGSMTAR
jgi:RNA polymerase sigma-70 factor (ECF subfamily)